MRVLVREPGKYSSRLLVCHGTRDETENDAPRVLVCHEARDEEVCMRVLVCMLRVF